jgi:hypothetical protein
MSEQPGEQPKRPPLLFGGNLKAAASKMDKKVASRLGLGEKKDIDVDAPFEYVVAARDSIPQRTVVFRQDEARVWPAGLVAARLIDAMTSDRFAGVSLTGRGVVELGSGSGIAGIVAASCGAGFTNVTLTDLECVLVSDTRANVNSNVANFDAGCTVRVQEFIWGTSPISSTSFTHPVDILIAADVVYSQETAEKLLSVIVGFFNLHLAEDFDSEGALKTDRFPLQLLWTFGKNRMCLSWFHRALEEASLGAHNDHALELVPLAVEAISDKLQKAYKITLRKKHSG